MHIFQNYVVRQLLSISITSFFCSRLLEWKSYHKDKYEDLLPLHTYTHKHIHAHSPFLSFHGMEKVSRQGREEKCVVWESFQILSNNKILFKIFKVRIVAQQVKLSLVIHTHPSSDC